MRKSYFLFYFFIALLLWNCSNSNKPPEYEIKIIETSDVHGAIFNYDFIQNTKSNTSLSQVQTYLKKERQNLDIILLDNGDILQGQPTVYYYNFQNTIDSHIVSKVGNYLQYDAATVGNHDIEAGHDVYDKIVKEFNYPLLAANAVRTDNGKPYFKPYVIINRKGFRIAVLGLITPRIPDWLPEELWSGIEFEDMIESAKKWVPIILEREKPDLLVGLFHSGFDFKYANSDENTYKNENASILVAKNVPGFDIIFIGHDHATWNESIINTEGNKVIILGPKNNAKQVAEAKIIFKKNSNGLYDKIIEAQIVDIKNFPVDSLFDVKFQKEFNEVSDYVSKQIGELSHTLNSHDAIYGPSQFMEFIHSIQLDLTHADISFAANQSFNSTIEKGPIYIRDMFKLFRYENFLYTMNLTGTEIKNYLEYSYANWFNTMNDESDHLLLFKLDESGNPEFNETNKSYSLKNMFYNFDVAGGLNYHIDISKPINQKINIISLTNGEPFYSDSIYTVAINSYRGNGGGGLLELGAGIPKNDIAKRRISSTDKDLRYYSINWIEEKKIVNTDFKSTWYIVPEKWWKKASQKDKELLNIKNN
ncbi:MAG: bifunctional metallophosphatase/5'-nucleotidase [Bacteroidetes bacterium GWF2_33_16]|nr:MAG: bifunctional metallophosphatase/5'-nucleotidase [Bacteroidetes bacterium GWE2_32_14]OFY05956.1 MAG: bifunctional metallophosphatase/5'-nucleotidase [Bacteroidetes bacterium GWF2_33_16]